MPLYDYRCTVCRREVEVMHSIYGTGPDVCESCGGAMRKALSSPAIHFKGSGWAKKDAAASAKQGKPKSGSSTSGASDSKGAGKDAAPAGAGKTETGSPTTGTAKGQPVSSNGTTSD